MKMEKHESMVSPCQTLKPCVVINMNTHVKEIKIHGQSKLSVKENRKRFIENVFKENLTNFLAQATLKIYSTPFKVIKVFMTICVLGSSGLALL